MKRNLRQGATSHTDMVYTTNQEQQEKASRLYHMLAKCLPRYFQEPTATSASNASQCLSQQSIDPLYLQHYLFPISIAAPQPFQLSNAPKVGG